MNSVKNTGPRRFLAAGLLVCAASIASFPVAASPAEAKRLIDALEDQGIKEVAALVRSGVNVNAIKSGDGSVLMVAAKRGDLDAVNQLLELGADVNVTATGDGTALIAASSEGHVAIVERLLAAGAQIDTVVSQDETALIAASRKGHLDVVSYLVSQKADVNLGVRTPSGVWRTPLNQARTPGIRSFLENNGARATRG